MSATGLTTKIRRLPGLRFEAQSPPLADALPRMDVAVFVGFASSGPINQPVVIEDSAQFVAIFGGDAPLGWDADRGVVLRAYLGPAVREFFRQGGRRCWIIRVARGAKCNYFPIPSLLELRANGDLFPAFARARSEGSWSDALRVGTTLQTHSIEVTRASFDGLQFELSPNSPGDVQPGDLLRFNLRNEGCGLFAVVESTAPVEPELRSPPAAEISSAKERRVARRRSVRVQCAKPFWFKTQLLQASGLNGISHQRVSEVSIVNEDGSIGPLLENAFSWSLSDEGQSITFSLNPPLAVLPKPGDRLLVDYFDIQMLITVQADANEEVLSQSSPPQPVQVSGRVARLVLPHAGQASTFNHDGIERSIQVTGVPVLEGQTIKLDCSLALADAPAPGTVIRVDFGSEQFWLTVLEVSSLVDPSGLSQTGSVRVEGAGFWPLARPPLLSPLTPVAAERLSFDLIVRETGDNLQRLSDLGFEQKHSRYWGDWPTDSRRYRGMQELAFIVNSETNQAAARQVFPLAESQAGEQQVSRPIYLPLAMPFMAGPFAGSLTQTQTALERDGLAVFGPDLFLDEKLIDANVESLMSQADHFRYQTPARRDLEGIYAALEIEEATIIAVPDAVHRGWMQKSSQPDSPQSSELLTHPKWWRYLTCNPSSNKLPVAGEPAWENFLDCDLTILAAPNLSSEEKNSGGTVSLLWTTVANATRYVVEESRSPDWNATEVVYSGTETHVVIYGRSAGDYFYRVRGESVRATSEWSAGITVRTSSVDQWQLEKKEAYRPDTLLQVHRALLRLCAARADLFAVLTLPSHYREDDAITHAEILRPASGPLFNLPPPMQTGRSVVQPLSTGEERATSYGAIYHPWFITRRDNLLEPWQLVPPDGAACGVMARRAITRGAWSAPANELLRGVVALAPSLAAGRWSELQDAQVNIFRHEPRGFLSLSADTLSRDIDLRPINVRRLLILLRRLALRLGETYVFEPNDDSLRRLVQRGFEAALDQMFVRGAFAGRTAATSYQVITDDSINTPRSVDQGRFIVELRVAPSLPLTFITVRLIQTNDHSSVTEVR